MGLQRQGGASHDATVVVVDGREVDSQPISFMVEVDTTTDPIAGTLRREGAEIAFVGWIGLARGLERLLGLAAAAEIGEQPGPDPQPGADEQAT